MKPTTDKRKPQGRRKTKPASTRGRGVSTLERREVVRRLLLELVPESEIVRRITTGLTDAATGKLVHASKATVYRDLQAIGDEYRDLHTDPAVMERRAAHMLHRLHAVYNAAMGLDAVVEVDEDEVDDDGKPVVRVAARRNYSAAIRAIEVEARLAGLQHPRWDVRKRDDVQPDATAPEPLQHAAKRYATMDDDALEERRAQLLERAASRGLKVHNGG